LCPLEATNNFYFVPISLTIYTKINNMNSSALNFLSWNVSMHSCSIKRCPTDHFKEIQGSRFPLDKRDISLTEKVDAIRRPYEIGK
jgi:hypothetical protein